MKVWSVRLIFLQMAEGGREDEDDKIVYSFRNFNVSVGNSEPNDEETSGEKIFNEPDLGVPLKRGRDRPIDDEKVPRKEENPFSFRHFLNKDQSSSPGTSKSESLRHSQSVDSDGLKQRDRVGPDVAQSVLPDFVQDHLILESTSNTNIKPVSGTHCLPDLRLPFDDVQAKSEFSIRKSGARGSQDDLVLDPSCRPKNIRKKTTVPQQQSSDVSVTSSLPDFLSDGPMSSNLADGIQGTSRVQVQRDECDSSEFTDLRAEKDALSKELDETRQLLAAESNKFRVFRLQTEVERFREKERDETVALEQVVNQVEANLQSTTQRAVTSETIILKLKQEIKTLQAQVCCLKAENASLQSKDRTRTSSIVEKAKAASDQITAATSTAEQQLRQLLSGLESLRLVSAILSDIDRVTDESEPSSRSFGKT